MKRKNWTRMRENYDYWKNPEKPYPYTVYWKIVAGSRKLDVLEDHDIIFDEYDEKIRKLPISAR